MKLKLSSGLLWSGVTRSATLMLACGAYNVAQALDTDMPIGDLGRVHAILNTTVTAGVGIRTQSPSVNLIGKTNLNPTLCEGPNGAYQSCQGLFRDQIYPSQILFSAPGAASSNTDDGDLNYGKGELTSAVGKLTQDLTLTWKDYGIFARWLYYYDVVNNDFTQYHPNRITPENLLQVGRQTPASPGLGNGLAGLLLNPRPYGQPGPNGSRLVYGRGAVVRDKRSDDETLKQIGTDLQGLDLYLYGTASLWGDRTLAFKLGRQTVSWGESTTLVVNSINSANPVNANNYYRIGHSTEEIFTPIAMADVSFDVVENYNLEAFYQFEWRNTEAAAPGSYFSDLDIGTNNAGRSLTLGAGNAEDPSLVATPLDTPLAGLSNSTSSLRRLPDVTPGAAGQFGVALKHSFDDWGNGVQIGAYFMNYHSRLPVGSLYATNPSCARKDGNREHIDATGLLTFLATCPDVPFLHAITHPDQPEAQYATDNAAPLDTARFQLEYPKNIKLYGLSFNTTLGNYSIQGEVAYRPNLPLQVDLQDVGFAALGPALTACHDVSTGCKGSVELANIGLGYNASGNAVNYGSSDFIPAPSVTAFPDILNVGIGHIPGSARAFPNFVIPYRGGQIGDNVGCPVGMSDADYHPGIPCYIRGYEREQVYQFNLGTTRVLGPNDNYIGADQILLVSEWGATWVPFMPKLDQLQFEAPGTYYAATAGADGSGANGSRQACSTNPACSVGPDGERFNAHQQDLTGYPDPLSWGYRLIAFMNYENVLPGIGLHPTVMWSHDVAGTSPGPGGNFIAGRKETELIVEARLRQSLSLSVGYTWFFGGGVYNTLSDRDFAQAFIKYQF
jgi:hypothetical protein